MQRTWREHLRRRRWWFLALALAPLLVIGVVALSIWFYSGQSSRSTADAAIILGAAVWTRRPSPVFRERIDHAVDLYRGGQVRKLIFTGGRAEGDALSEAAAGRRYALAHGVPPQDILTETSSTATYENLSFARPIARRAGLQTFLIVSDPLHMRRAMLMAHDLGYDARPSPTPTSRYQTLSSRAGFLARETIYLLGYLARRPFRHARSV